MNIAYYDPETFELSHFIEGEPRPEAHITPEGLEKIVTEKSKSQITGKNGDKISERFR